MRKHTLNRGTAASGHVASSLWCAFSTTTACTSPRINLEGCMCWQGHKNWIGKLITCVGR